MLRTAIRKAAPPWARRMVANLAREVLAPGVSSWAAPAEAIDTNNRADLFTAYGPAHGVEWLEGTFATQSLIFYAELLPALYQLSVACRQRSLAVLDIGPASCAGTSFLHNAMNCLLGQPASFTGIDKAPEFERYVRATYPRINYKVGDIFSLDRNAFDIVLCSHTLEHIPEPHTFVARCNEIARKFCLFYTPYREENRIEGHLHCIDDAFIAGLPRVLWSCVKRSIGWWPSDPDARTVLFVTVADDHGAIRRHSSLRSNLSAEYSTALTMPTGA